MEDPIMRIALVEDDPADLRQMSEFLSRFSAESGVDIQTVPFSNGMEFISSYRPAWDAIFMDVVMPVLDGLSAARKVRESDREVIIVFITSFAQFAVDSYSVSALDYVLKPLNYNSVALKFRRIRKMLDQRTDRSFIISNSEGLQRLALRDIYYIEVINHTMTYYTTQGVRSATGSTTIRSLEESFREDGFARCSQGHLVNLRCVDTVEQNAVLLVNGERIPISRNRRKPFLQAYMDYWGA